MRISELVEKTQVSKQAIHHYINEGFLPKPEKKGKVSAEYTEDHVDQLRLIKELRENYFLPLSVIKNVIQENERRETPDRVLFDFKAKHFRPLEWLLEETVVGKDAYLAATGIDAAWLDRMEGCGVIAPEMDGDEPAYTPDDVLMGKLIAEMDKTGVGPNNGFAVEALMDMTRLHQEAMEKVQEQFIRPLTEEMPAEERVSKSKMIADLMGMFFYYLNRKKSC